MQRREQVGGGLIRLRDRCGRIALDKTAMLKSSVIKNPASRSA
jgi:hypothetical protein